MALGGVNAVFHKPHPEREIGQGMVRSLREFLVGAEVEIEPGEDEGPDDD